MVQLNKHMGNPPPLRNNYLTEPGWETSGGVGKVGEWPQDSKYVKLP